MARDSTLSDCTVLRYPIQVVCGWAGWSKMPQLSDIYFLTMCGEEQLLGSCARDCCKVILMVDNVVA